MLRYLSITVFALLFIGCQSDSDTPPEETQKQPGNQQQFQQQTAPDIEVSDEEIDSFTDAIAKAQKIQMEFQQEMVGIVEEEGMDVETFNKIARANEQGQSADELDVSQEDMEKFATVSGKLQEAQSGINEEIEKAVEETGMEMSRFQEINRALQQDPELQKEIRQKLQQNQTEQ